MPSRPSARQRHDIGLPLVRVAPDPKTPGRPVTINANGRPCVIVGRSGDHLTLIRADHDIERVPAASVSVRRDPLPPSLQGLTEFFARDNRRIGRGASVEFLHQGQIFNGVVCRRTRSGIEIATRTTRMTVETAFVRPGPSLDAGPGAPSPMDRWSVKLHTCVRPFSLDIDGFTATLSHDGKPAIAAANHGAGEPNTYSRLPGGRNPEHLESDAQTWLAAQGASGAIYRASDLWILFETSARHLGIDASEFTQRFDLGPSSRLSSR